jgi:hypothetical protein
VNQCCSSGTDIIVCVAQGSESSFKEVDADGYPDVDSRVESRGGEVQHDANYEAEEGEDVLEDEEFVPEISDGGESGEV